MAKRGRKKGTRKRKHSSSAKSKIGQAIKLLQTAKRSCG